MPRHRGTCVRRAGPSARSGELVRIVRDLRRRRSILDTTRPTPHGRGAYLCADPACWQLALRRSALEAGAHPPPMTSRLELRRAARATATSCLAPQQVATWLVVAAAPATRGAPASPSERPEATQNGAVQVVDPAHPRRRRDPRPRSWSRSSPSSSASTPRTSSASSSRAASSRASTRSSTATPPTLVTNELGYEVAEPSTTEPSLEASGELPRARTPRTSSSRRTTTRPTSCRGRPS